MRWGEKPPHIRRTDRVDLCPNVGNAPHGCRMRTKRKGTNDPSQTRTCTPLGHGRGPTPSDIEEISMIGPTSSSSDGSTISTDPDRNITITEKLATSFGRKPKEGKDPKNSEAWGTFRRIASLHRLVITQSTSPERCARRRDSTLYLTFGREDTSVNL